jgi:hypothetical protein
MGRTDCLQDEVPSDDLHEPGLQIAHPKPAGSGLTYPTHIGII